MEQARRARHRRAPLDPAPQRLEDRGVGGEILARPPFGFGARDQAGGRRLALGEDGAQPRALGLVLDPARDAEVRRAGEEDQVAAGQRDVRAHPRALAGERVLAHLDHDLLSLLEQIDDRRAAGRRLVVVAVVVVRSGAGRAGVALRAPVDRRLVVAHGVAHVEEGVALQATVDERRLHAGKDAGDPALVQVADQPALAMALERDLGQAIVLEHRDARLVRVALDQQRLLDQRFTQRRKSTPRIRPVTKKLQIVNDPP